MLPVEVRDLPQADEINLGVGARGLGTAMAEMVSDLLERQAFGHKVGCTGVTQRVRSVVGAADVQYPHARRDQVMQAAGSQRANWSLDRQEQRARCTALAHLLQVSKDRIAQVGRQWVILLATQLRSSDVKDLLLPTYIVQRQSNDLTAT